MFIVLVVLSVGLFITDRSVIKRPTDSTTGTTSGQTDTTSGQTSTTSGTDPLYQITFFLVFDQATDQKIFF